MLSKKPIGTLINWWEQSRIIRLSPFHYEQTDFRGANCLTEILVTVWTHTANIFVSSIVRSGGGLSRLILELFSCDYDNCFMTLYFEQDWATNVLRRFSNRSYSSFMLDTNGTNTWHLIRQVSREPDSESVRYQSKVIDKNPGFLPSGRLRNEIKDIRRGVEWRRILEKSEQLYWDTVILIQ